MYSSPRTWSRATRSSCVIRGFDFKRVSRTRSPTMLSFFAHPLLDYHKTQKSLLGGMLLCYFVYNMCSTHIWRFIIDGKRECRSRKRESEAYTTAIPSI